jgi:hypothetical protein
MKSDNAINIKHNLISSSFRDPAAQVYIIDGVVYRQINEPGYNDYNKLMKSGLYERLVSLGYLIPHTEVKKELAADSRAITVIKPEKVNFISYPYEWSFSQLKSAALLTLEITKVALEFGMTLKDANAYNIQFHHGKPIFIDTSSFESYKEGSPWTAYYQFCKHFLAPLSLMSKVDIRMGALIKQYIDGIPLDLTSKLLPLNSWLSLSTLGHIHLHAKSQTKYSDAAASDSVEKTKSKVKVSKNGMYGLVDNLLSLIKSQKWRPVDTEWGDYYTKTNYSDTAVTHKGEIINSFISKLQPDTVWDLGGNTGFYSRIAASSGADVLSFDIDPVAVEANYQKVCKDNDSRILPLLMDLTNPSPMIGWAHSERESLHERGPADIVMALALTHHLAISNNVPLNQIAEYFSSLGEYLIIEFVPKEDSQVKRLLSSRKDIFPNYTIDGFKKAFSEFYNLLGETPVRDTHRSIHLMKKK